MAYHEIGKAARCTFTRKEREIVLPCLKGLSYLDLLYESSFVKRSGILYRVIEAYLDSRDGALTSWYTLASFSAAAFH
jgi:hypothetical protein